MRFVVRGTCLTQCEVSQVAVGVVCDIYGDMCIEEGEERRWRKEGV